MASEKITAIIDSVKELSVLELKELIDAYCEEFGVSAVAAAAPAAAGAAAATADTPYFSSIPFTNSDNSITVKLSISSNIFSIFSDIFISSYFKFFIFMSVVYST